MLVGWGATRGSGPHWGDLNAFPQGGGMQHTHIRYAPTRGSRHVGASAVSHVAVGGVGRVAARDGVLSRESPSSWPVSVASLSDPGA